jgi:Flp pilus assembly protein TadB
VNPALKNLGFALLAVAALFAGGWAMGWPGVILVLSVLVFLLMLQFTKIMRTMKRMGAAPIGQTGSCLMLNSRLHAGLPLLQVLELAGSLGEPVEGEKDRYRWRDPGGDTLLLRFDARSRLLDWTFSRAS